MNSRKGMVLASAALTLCVCSTLILWGDCVPQWNLSTPMPDPTTDYAVGVLNHKLVMAGGDYWEGSKGHWIHKHVSSAAQTFDPATQEWQKLARNA